MKLRKKRSSCAESLLDDGVRVIVQPVCAFRPLTIRTPWSAVGIGNSMAMTRRRLLIRVDRFENASKADKQETALKMTENNGGRAGIRTPDLLPVKNVRDFHGFDVVDCFLSDWIGSGHLLPLRSDGRNTSFQHIFHHTSRTPERSILTTATPYGFGLKPICWRLAFCRTNALSRALAMAC